MHNVLTEIPSTPSIVKTVAEVFLTAYMGAKQPLEPGWNVLSYPNKESFIQTTISIISIETATSNIKDNHVRYWCTSSAINHNVLLSVAL